MNDFLDLSRFTFVPLAEVKAKLSAWIRGLVAGQNRVAVTVNGRPQAVLLSYQDYLTLARQHESPQSESRGVIPFEEWKRNRRQQEKVRDSIEGLFDMSSLPRKGQKSFKRETVRGFDR